MHLRPLASTALLAGLLAAGLALPWLAAAAEPTGRLDLPSFSHLQSKATEVVDLTLGTWPLALASKLMEADDPESVEVKKVLSGIKSIAVRSYEFDSDFVYSQDDVQSVRAQLAAPGWTQLAQVRKRNRAEEMTRRTLTAALKLIDPAWGGVYQYSTDSDWDHPHFEKIMAMQAEPMRLYALAYGQFHDARYLQAARDIHRYVTTFLRSPEGAFYTSQDADLVKGEHSEKYFALGDAARRKLGAPVVDKHRYARENGWMIHALATAYTVTGDRVYLDDAQRAARWIVTNRSLPGGGFRHDEKDAAGPYLEDTLAMGEAFLALYSATGEREWLARAAAGAGFIEQHFRGAQPGYVTSAPRSGARLQPKANIDENIPVARFANMLHRYTGDARYRAMGDYALRMLVTDEVAGSLLTAPGILLAAFESVNDPLHITVVGGKDDAAAVALFDSAIRYAAVYRRIEWWDRREGNMPNPDVRYPKLPRAAAFICTDSTCSLPIFDASKISTEVARSVRQVAKN